MELCQFTEYSMRCIFLEISYTKYGGEAIVEKLFPNLFLKIQNWAYLWINSLKFCFYCMQVKGYQNILKVSYRPLALI